MKMTLATATNQPLTSDDANALLPRMTLRQRLGRQLAILADGSKLGDEKHLAWREYCLLRSQIDPADALAADAARLTRVRTEGRP